MIKPPSFTIISTINDLPQKVSTWISYARFYGILAKGKKEIQIIFDKIGESAEFTSHKNSEALDFQNLSLLSSLGNQIEFLFRRTGVPDDFECTIPDMERARQKVHVAYALFNPAKDQAVSFTLPATDPSDGEDDNEFSSLCVESLSVGKVTIAHYSVIEFEKREVEGRLEFFSREITPKRISRISGTEIDLDKFTEAAKRETGIDMVFSLPWPDQCGEDVAE